MELNDKTIQNVKCWKPVSKIRNDKKIYAGWSVPPRLLDHADPVPHINFVLDSFSLICLEVNSNPSETHHSNRVDDDTRWWVPFFYQKSARGVFNCQYKPALEPILTRFAVSQHRCPTITLLRRAFFSVLIRMIRTVIPHTFISQYDLF